MTIRPSTAKIIDLDTAFDVASTETAAGEVLWATVTIKYSLAGLNPAVTIRVPVPWRGEEGPDHRRSQALRCARQLIEHACRASGVGPQESEPSFISVGNVIETLVPAEFEGISQELGFTKPTVKPKCENR